MNNRHIENLTHRLLQALDGNYDVINMEAVLSVIAALESTTITKEQLEATRLAKYINLFRRRTQSEQLAKRAKSLLKKWREMVGIQQPIAGPSAGGPVELQYTKPTSPLASNSSVVSTVEKQSRWNMREESSEPTSFINLIPNFSSSFSNHNSTANSNLNGPNARVGRKSRNTKNQPEAFNSDQFANSNSMNVNTMPPTIVIDIEDSNSGSNVIEKQDDVVIIGETNAIIKTSKHKKTKKEKKKPRNARDMQTDLVVIDAESSESQQPADRMASAISAAIEKPQDKSRNTNLTATNMSEILSLSNSSMSCIFPTSLAGESKIYSSQQLTKALNLTEAELSFAGKFGGAGSNTTVKVNTCDSSTANAGPPSLSGDIYAYNENSNILSSGTVPKTSGKSRVFGGSAYNSNDSVSNSRQSNHETVEIACPGIPNTPANTTNMTLGSATPAPLEKMPKKRGRKKGSKGVDSLIAKDTSLSSQMLMQSLSGGNKKVKTTKELYAEMQNRKLGVSTPTTPSHWTSGSSQPHQSQQTRRDSFCSEPSLHSPRTFDACSTNATISTIATNSTTPDKNTSGLRKCFDTGVVDVDSTSDSVISGVLSRGSVVQESTTKVLAAVEQQLLDLAQKLPPKPSISDIEKVCAEDIVPCTCRIIEILPEKPETVAEQASAAMGELLSLDKLNNSNIVAGEDTEMPVITISVAGNNGGNEGQAVDFKEAVKPKKSIFDLDFDDDEDPLHTLIAEVAAASAVCASTEVANIENDSPYESKQESTQSQNFAETPSVLPDQTSSLIPHVQDPSAVPAVPLMPLFPSYKIEEDAFCLAKERFELQTQQITGFHINLLHNFFIPNVNGNWNNAVGNTSTSTADKQNSFQVVDGLNVVPKLSVEDHIRKDLREFSFRRKLKPKSTEIISKHETPFLGVARCLTKRHRKTRRHRQIRTNSNTEISPRDSNIPILNNSTNNTVSNDLSVKKEESEASEDIELKHGDVSKPWNLSVINQKPTMEAITINVDNDSLNDNNANAVCSVDSQNLLAIAANLVDFAANDETSKVKASVDALKPEGVSDQLAYPNISGDILNNNNNSCSLKFEEEPSSCESHSSLKQTQNSINQKLRKHRRRQKRQLELEQSSPKSSTKRKRRRKKPTPPLKIKCIKIAINGGITTQRHIKIASSNSGSSSELNSSDVDSSREERDNNDLVSEASIDAEAIDEDVVNDENEFSAVCGDEEDDIEDENGEYGDEDDGNDYIGEFHEVVTRNLSPSTALGNNHIVLTIKKTPSKTNSPASNSPNVVNHTPTSTVTSTTIRKEAIGAKLEESTALVSESHSLETQNINEDLIEKKQTQPCNLLAAAYAAIIKDQSMRQRFRRRRRKKKNQDPQPFRFPDEICSEEVRIFKKKHQQLFFPEEIFTQPVGKNSKQRIFNMSSCSSSCYESSEFEYESSSSAEDKKIQKIKPTIKSADQCKQNISSSSSSASSFIDSEEEYTKSSVVLETDGSGTLEVSKNETKDKDDDQLSEYNNGLLISFNNICTQDTEGKVPEMSTSETKNGVSSHFDEKPISNLNPRPEYKTGIRTLNEPRVPDSDSLSNIPISQQFKEWYQVLQLKSYNDEPLTVLPYVVLD